MFNRKTTESIDAEISKLQAERQTLLERREFILIDIGENPNRAEALEKEFSRNDLRLQSIPAVISKLEAQRRELEIKAARVQIDALKKPFEAGRSKMDGVIEAQRREAIRAQLIGGQYQRVVSSLATSLYAQRQQALDLINSLDLSPDEADALKASFYFNRADLSSTVDEFERLKAQMIDEIQTELEQRYNVTLTG